MDGSPLPSAARNRYTAMSPTSKTYQLSVQVYFSWTLTALVWADNPPVGPMMDNSSGLPVALVLALLLAEFHGARVKFPGLSMVSSLNPVHQSPTTGSVRITTGNGEADAAEIARLNDTRSRVNIPNKPLKYTQFIE